MSTATVERRLPMPALVGTAFGGLWSVLGATALSLHWTIPAAAAGLLITALLIALRCRSAGYGSGVFRRRAYLVAVGLEVVGLYLAMLLLQKYELEAFFVQALGLVVGLHFIGLWVASGQRRYLWLCSIMCVVSLIGILLPGAASGDFNLRNVVTSYGCAVALWLLARPTIHGPVSSHA